ncbi:Rec8 like protein-domain-containing protein [Vararia minispora EC-137]|uniref:Rec8 like protein-domain-containing protein n=1 Tax=Vararia minispora EC-137 TaxID=1314806 RepID=A0ACB8QHP0_9AGAM|nr:Rec8 like protein-domain-containing protein [Vararia minispora EC-137]
MFFTQELLSQRNSGFGLLWLAATLGAKSSFKKLPKRDVMDADISELCGLIVEPIEPLALRLSSNLMVGVARVYKVKHEIFLGDVTTFHTTLKKAIRDFNATALDLQMGQSSVRPDVVTMVADPALATGLNYDDYLDRYQTFSDDGGKLSSFSGKGSDDEYGKRKKKKGRKVPATERPRRDLHILDETFELLSGSFDASQLGSGLGDYDRSSSQADAATDFEVYEDNLFQQVDLDMGEIGEELAQELGEGWASVPPTQVRAAQDEDAQHIDVFRSAQDLGTDMDSSGFMFNAFPDPSDDTATRPRGSSVVTGNKRIIDAVDHGEQVNVPEDIDVHWQGALTPRSDPKDIEDNIQFRAGEEEPPKAKPPSAARSHYWEVQNQARRDIEMKRLEKESASIIEDMLWGIPRGLHAPALVDFWRERVKDPAAERLCADLSNRSGTPHRGDSESFAAKRTDAPFYIPATEWGAPVDTALDFGDPFMQNGVYTDQDEPARASHVGSQRSSEEPGQARRGSHPASPLGGQFDFAFRQPFEPEPTSASQRSAVFPWDHAGPSSSSAGGRFDPAHDQISVGHHEVRIRRGSSAAGGSRRESLVPSSLPGGRGFSPSAFQRLGSQIIGGDFEFEVPEEGTSHASSTLDATLVTLERNSFKFLEYVRMQARTVSQPADGLSFDVVVPKATSSKHIAAAAFYHCLVLAGKELIRVRQAEPYGEILVNIM